MKRSAFLVLLTFGFALPTSANVINDFTGPYDVANWTTTITQGGSVDTSGAPASVSLTSSDTGSGNSETVDFTVAAAANGNVTFDWVFVTNDVDGPIWDPFGYLLNGTFTQLTDDLGPDTQFSTFMFSVLEGDIFGFRAFTVDDLLGASTTVIEKFMAPAPCSSYLGSEIGAGKCIENGTVTVDAMDQIISGTLDVRAGGGTVDSNGNDATLTGVIFGTGGLTKTGLGSVTLAAENTYTGRTIVDQGTLAIDGSIASGVTVNPNGTLRGTGVINGDAQVAGRLAPGNALGTLTFNAPVVLLPGSVLQIDVDGPGTGNGAGNYSRVLVQGAGNTFTAAGDFQPVLRGISGDATNSYTPGIGQSFTPVTATGGILGTFDSLTQPNGLAAGTRFDLLYDPTAVQLVVTPARYSALPNLPLSGNARSVGAALDAGRPAAHARKDALFRALAILTEPQLAVALPQLAGEIHADMIAASFNVHRIGRGFAFGRLQDLRLGRRTPGMQYTAAASADATGMERYVWLRAAGGRFDTDGDGDGESFDENLYGIAGGADFPIAAGLHLGAAIAYGHGSVDTSTQGDGDTSTVQLMAYGLWQKDQWFANFALGYGWDDYDTDRVVALSPARSLSSDTDGDSVFLDLEGGMRTNWREYVIEPTVGIRSDVLNRSRFSEQGLGGLDVRSDSWQALQTRLGAKLSRNWKTNGMDVTPELRLYWLHDFGDAIASESTAVLAGRRFRVQAADAGRDALAAGLGARMTAAENLDLYLDYDFTYRSSQTSQTIAGGLQLSW